MMLSCLILFQLFVLFDPQDVCRFSISCSMAKQAASCRGGNSLTVARN
jgi:hypothetical protein